MQVKASRNLYRRWWRRLPERPLIRLSGSLKLDGYRAISVIERSGSARVWSRNGLTLEKKFPAISKALTHLELQSTILDGEIFRPTASGRDVRDRQKPGGQAAISAGAE
jgi:ATP-dependent DNA ligase